MHHLPAPRATSPSARTRSFGVFPAAALVATALLTAGCGGTGDAPEAHDDLRASLTFYASFDGEADADYSLGDRSIYTAPSWGDRTLSREGLPADSLVAHASGEGLYGDALYFPASDPNIVFFQAEDNLYYSESDWSGTISFWISLDPDEDLAPGYSDPLQISASAWNDGALFVDFTQEDDPRHFRFAAFADYDVWNPEDLDWSEIAFEDRPMIDIADPPFDRDRWTHVVMTFEHLNTGGADGVVTGYLNGEAIGTLSGREQTVTWNVEEAIVAIGLNYAGRFDELSLYDRALSDEEVRALYELEGGVASLF
ncbi:MAG: LamG-like jellyroll fold domain-containing protein [Rhodothermales bacterium]